MPQSVQVKPQVEIFEEPVLKLTIVLPDDLMPKGYPKLPIFKKDDIEAAISEEDDHVLHALTSGILKCETVDYLILSRCTRKVGDKVEKGTKLEVQLTTKVAKGVRGRIDALIRTNGYDPAFR